jgi:hypothetical protein
MEIFLIVAKNASRKCSTTVEKDDIIRNEDELKQQVTVQYKCF